MLLPNLYRRGKLHSITCVCSMTFHTDLEYWGIDKLLLDACCAIRHYPEMELRKKEYETSKKHLQREERKRIENDFGFSTMGRIRGFLWKSTEYPESSLTARILECLSLVIVLLSTITFILQSDIEIQDEHSSNWKENLLRTLDDFIICYFTVEYVLRLVCCPNKWRFFKHPMNMIDLLAIVPFYLTFVLDQLEDLHIIAKAGKTIRLVRVLRIIRIFKLVRHFAGLQSLIQTLSDAYKELGLLMMIVAISILAFAVLIYYAESNKEIKEENYYNRDGKIKTIFKSRSDTNWSFIDSLWWCIMTQTTVGSNHAYPSTRFGQIIGALCTVSGVFILSLPIPIVVNSFANSYKNQMWRNEMAVKKADRIQVAKRRLTKDMTTKILGLKERDSLLTFKLNQKKKRFSVT